MNSAAVITSVIVFSNDATELSFSDGSKLQLSPCGASFVCKQAPSRGHHPFIQGTQVQHRTEFCTSEFKDKVYQALECRNRFAERPYLCQQFLQEDSILHLYADIKEVEWPVSPKNICKTLANGVQVTSIDECASLTLSSNKYEFTVEFLCKLSQKRQSEKHHTVSKTHAEKKSDAVGRRSAGIQGYQATGLNSNKFNFTNQLGTMQDSPYYMEEDTSRCSQVSVNERKHFVETFKGKGDDTNPLQDQLKDNELGVVKIMYTWVLQHHSLEQCPECWKHPLYLALNFEPQDDLINTPKPDSKSEKPGESGVAKSMEPTDIDSNETKVLKDYNPCQKSEISFSDNILKCRKEKHSTPLPCALPQACLASHLHNWRTHCGGRVDIVEEDIPVGQSIKVWFSNGIVYRLSSIPQADVHIYPGDGTLIKSTGTQGFFKHIIPHGNDLDERMLCVRSPPPDHPGAAYSIAGVMRKASRLLQNVMQGDFGLVAHKTKCCWKMKEQWMTGSVIYPSPTVILEESTIEGLGSFVAYSNGRVRVVFSDRTILDMIHDFTGRISRNFSDIGLENSSDQPDTSNKITRIRKSVFSSNLQRGVCQLLLPNGEIKMVYLAHPQEYFRCVDVAMEWAAWVASSPEQRLNFYGRQNSQMAVGKDCDVTRELQKIKCLQYILETTLLPSGCADATPSATAGFDLDTALSANSVSDTEGITRTAFGPCSGEDETTPLQPDVIMPDYIQEALEKTSCAIRNIDSELGTSCITHR